MSPTDKRPVKQWDLSKIESFFAGRQLPAGPIRLSEWEIIVDPEKFVKYSLSILNRYNGNPYFLPIVARLRRFKNVIEK